MTPITSLALASHSPGASGPGAEEVPPQEERRAAHAAAAGTVVYAGWEGGYGNLTVIDHGGGIATAYGHQGSFAVSGGQHTT